MVYIHGLTIISLTQGVYIVGLFYLSSLFKSACTWSNLRSVSSTLVVEVHVVVVLVGGGVIVVFVGRGGIVVVVVVVVLLVEVVVVVVVVVVVGVVGVVL